MKKAVVWVLLVILVGLAACTPGTVNEPIIDTPTTPSVPIPPSPEHSPPGEHGEELLAKELLVQGNSAFAFELYKELREEGEEDSNLFYSPYSISTALAMTYAGARGETAEQMAGALNFDFGLPDERLHSAFNTMGEELAERGKGREMMVVQPEGEPVKENVEGFRLNIVNALWGQEGYEFLSDYLNLVERYYGGGMKTLDFISKPEPSRLEINNWASEQTEGRIKDLLPPGVINLLTRLILTNAIYFKARWEHEFSERATQDDTFYLLDGSQVTVPMMHQQTRFAYAEGNDYQAIRLPYLGGEIAMVVLLPEEGRFKAFDDSLDLGRLSDIIEDMESREVKLALPKFEFETEYALNRALADLGMTDAFNQGVADFSGMTGNRELFISDAIHKAFVSVDERGTEAAAVTAIAMAASAPPSGPVDFTADHPFIFLIQDIETGSILFIGRVMNPAA
jgi:serpin B